MYCLHELIYNYMPLLKKKKNIYYTRSIKLQKRTNPIQNTEMGTHHLGYKNCNNLMINIQSMLIFLINYNQLYVQVHIEFHIIICIVKYYMHPPIPKRKVQISRENINIIVNNIYTNVFFISVQTKRRSLIYIYIYLHSTRDRQFECCRKISLRKSAPKFNF